jgi:hypothetical protein
MARRVIRISNLKTAKLAMLRLECWANNHTLKSEPRNSINVEFSFAKGNAMVAATAFS